MTEDIYKLLIRCENPEHSGRRPRVMCIEYYEGDLYGRDDVPHTHPDRWDADRPSSQSFRRKMKDEMERLTSEGSKPLAALVKAAEGYWGPLPDRPVRTGDGFDKYEASCNLCGQSFKADRIKVAPVLNALRSSGVTEFPLHLLRKAYAEHLKRE